MREYEGHDGGSVESALDRAVAAQASFARTPDAPRLLAAAAEVLRAKKGILAGLITSEMGKPVRQSAAEVEKCALACEYFSRNGPDFSADLKVDTEAAESKVAFEPLGVILAVMPWNYPFWQVFRCAAPAIAAGNAVILKHASCVPGCALAIEDVFREAGAPPGLFASLLVDPAAALRIVGDSRIAAAALTGGEAAGRALAAAAGAAIKKTVLELGGSDPFVVADDADLPAAAAAAAASRFQNSGQSCISAKRFIAFAGIHDEFIELFKAAAAALRVGDPSDPETGVGPLAREDIAEDLRRQVDASVAAGAEIILGGSRIPGPGWFFEPTILASAARGMPVWDEETFGPVAAAARAGDAREALELANQTSFGLGADVWTRSAKTADFFARGIRAGSVFVNSFVKSDPRLPFGGVRNSGYGRELSAFGMREFANLKTVWIDRPLDA